MRITINPKHKKEPTLLFVLPFPNRSKTVDIKRATQYNLNARKSVYH